MKSLHLSSASRAWPNKFAIFTPVLLMAFLVILNLACNAATALIPTQTGQNPAPIATPAETQPQALITFEVQIPSNVPTRDPVYLSVLDEVTGLSLNPERHAMQAEDDTNYTVTLPFPMGTTIKYRYTRQGNYIAEENTSTNRPVRYRLYRVDGPGRVQDVVSAWSDTGYTGQTGRIMGKALEDGSSKPIPGLLVTAGGAYAITSYDGSFLIEGLPTGTHNLVVYAMDGSYRTFQQGATVAENATTPATILLTPATPVNIVFTLSVPPGTLSGVPVRIAGNLSQLGNSFSDLSGGVSTVASRMPVLSPLPDGRYSLTLTLHAGSDLAYKYTLGDGFWNAEHTSGGAFRVRHLIVPESNTLIEDEVVSWGSSEYGPVLFDLTVPSVAPQNDTVSIQFNSYGWMEPIPMWYLSENRWAYVLQSPLDLFDKLGYRYCRNGRCGSADDAETAGNDSFGRLLQIDKGESMIRDQVQSWSWLDTEVGDESIDAPDIAPREPEFIAGVEFLPGYHPSWMPHLPVTYKNLKDEGVNWVFLTPTWTVTQSSPPMIEPLLGRDPSWSDLVEMIQRAQSFGLQVALDPRPVFSQEAADWWAGAPRDFAWWNVWFERYRNFVLYHAAVAQSQGASALILGGSWISPALPGGVLADGSASGVPEDAETRWLALIDEVRNSYSGQLIWEIPYPEGLANPPPFLHRFDAVYLLWSAPLADQNSASAADMQSEAAGILDNEVKPFQEETGKPVLLAVAYPSAQGGATGCVPDPQVLVESGCLDLDLLSRPNADIPPVERDLEEQFNAYQAMLVAANTRNWISGFISRGYYPPAALQDKSISVHGKPAEALLAYWYPRIRQTAEP